MNPSTLSFGWLLFADFLVALAVILAAYIFLLNPRQRANFFVSMAMFVIAIANLGIAMSFRARAYEQVELYLLLNAAVTPIMAPVLILATLALMKPQWVSGRKTWLRNLLLFLAIIPALVLVVDVVAGTHLYYSGIDPNQYTGGYVEFAQFLDTDFGRGVVYVYVIGLMAFLILPLGYFAFFDRPLTPVQRRLARILLIVQVLGIVLTMGLEDFLFAGLATVLISTMYALAYAYAAFQQMISERQYQAGRLRTRLTALTMAITLPLLIFLANSVISEARLLLEDLELQRLSDQGQALTTSTSLWLTGNATALQNMAMQPGIRSMDAEQQRPILQSFAATYPYMYLVSTTDHQGSNIARNDDNPLTSYNDRAWFWGAMGGNEISYQLLIGRTSGRPALVVSTPIRDDLGKIVGVAMFASELTEISDLVVSTRIGETGYAYLVNETNNLVAHPQIDELMLEEDPQATPLVSFSEDPPVQALRQGRAAPFRFVDADGNAQVAYYNLLENNWGLVVQRQSSELLRASQTLQRTAWGIIGIGSLILLGLVWATMVQSFRPVTTLTDTVQSITAGNLDQVAPVESGDEIGTLARAFNVMTSQLRDLIGGLERRVAERTLDLEHRSAQLEAAAEVGRAAATIRDLDELLPLVTNLIAERFGFYHVGVFLLDERKEYAVLRAANSDGGKRMLARGHRLQVGQQGIVGYVTSQRAPRIALNVGQDATFFNNPDLPDTQSEMALPLQVGTELLGALDVQSTESGAFSEQDVRTLQVLADQVAIAINQAGLLQQTAQLLESERRLYGEISRRAWVEQMRGMVHKGVKRTQDGIIPLNEVPGEQARSLLEAGKPIVDAEDAALLYVPVRVRSQVIGILRARRGAEAGKWGAEEIRMVETLAEQLSLSLESARSYQETEMTAQRERLLGEIGARIRQTLDLETILRAASQEVRQALDLQKVVVRLGKPSEEESGGDGRDPVSGGSDG